MDETPVTPDQQHGLGSWHPAIRPNTQDTHESNAVNSQIYSHPTVTDEAVSQNAASYQLPLRPKSSSQHEPSAPSPQVDSTNAQRAQEFSTVVGDKIDLSDPDTPGPNIVGDDKAGWSGLANAVAGPDVASGPGSGVQGLVGNEFSNPPDTTVVDGQNQLSKSSDDVKGLSGDQSQIDKIWEIEETASSNQKAHISRTNSFPVVPPLKQEDSWPPHPLPHSQAENVMEDDEAIDTSRPWPASDTLHEVAPTDPFELLAGDDDQGFFANPPSPGATAMVIGADKNSRYEEGLPLVSVSRDEVVSGQPDGAEGEPDRNGNDKDDYFGKGSIERAEETVDFKPHPLDRKSTNQVLDSMQYAPYHVTHDKASQDLKPSLANQTDGGVTVSTSKVALQVSADQNIDNQDPSSNDEDLAEMWKAALGDDELLDENDTLDPSALFGEDDEGFLEDDRDTLGDGQSQTASPPILEPTYSFDGKIQGFGDMKPRQEVPQNKYVPTTGSQSRSYPHAENSVPVSNHSIPTPPGLADRTRQQHYPMQALTRPQMPASTQSFADKSKGGYTSPYDLPMDVTRPKKRSQFQQLHPSSDVRQPSSRPPPPRSSSMFTGAPPIASSQPPIPRLPNSYSSGQGPLPSSNPPPGVNSFFEELPSTSSRPSSSMGRIPPQQPPPRAPPTPQAPLMQPPQQSLMSQATSSNTATAAQPYQLLPPEKMSLYENSRSVEPNQQSVPVVNARYSPAPAPLSGVPPPRTRYAASPSGAVRPPSSQTLPFQPRTSSPLAQNSTRSEQSQQQSVNNPSPGTQQTSDIRQPGMEPAETPSFGQSDKHAIRNGMPASFSHVNHGYLTDPAGQASSPPSLSASQHARLSTPASDSSYAIYTPEPDVVSSEASPSFTQGRDAPSYPSENANHGLLRRSQTQSPVAGKYAPQTVTAQAPFQRPASVNQAPKPHPEGKMYATGHTRPRGRTFSKDLDYIKPTDGRELDRLERWKGYPIFSFGFGGAIVTSFPKQIPRYAAGQIAPMTKCSPGEVQLRDGKILPIEDDIATFPGPLKSKSRKKDVTEWLQRRIARLEDQAKSISTSSVLPDPVKRHDEKILLWKIMQILVENDGSLDKSTGAEKAVRAALSPELTRGDDAMFSAQAPSPGLSGIKRWEGSRSIANPVTPEAIEGLRKTLLHGEREKAVWHAVDNCLWAHAMLLASTLDQSIWKQVSQEFVRREVKTYGENTEALAALFQIFAGNWEESADELVPPSARAGLQMVSKTAGTGPTKNALDGLDRWRESLTLILSNRTADDGKALTALGRLLAGYGRTEAAHICFIFANSPQLFGGPDDPQVGLALLGADHLQHPFDYGRDLDSILLTEVYDYARTILSSSSSATVSPHLQSLKVYHGMILTEYGYKSEAQQYCEVITGTLNSTTKRSPYYHTLLVEVLNGLMERLRQAPRDSPGSWISKPSIDKVSGSIWAKFNQYVAGDESDTASTGSGRAHDSSAGPFAGVSGETPIISRTASSNDLYNAYIPNVTSTAVTNTSNSRYAPTGSHIPRSSFEQQGQSIPDAQRFPVTDQLRPAAPQQQYQSRPTSSSGSNYEPFRQTGLAEYPVRTNEYLPSPPSQPQSMPVPAVEELSPSLYPQYDNSTLPSVPQVLQLHPDHSLTNGYEQAPSYIPQDSYQPPVVNHYEPPGLSSYDPPSNSLDHAQEMNSPSEDRPKKKSFMDVDEDEDFEARAAAIRKEEKARKDREADEAFRQAAEADGKGTARAILYQADNVSAEKDKAPKLNSKKSGWLSGWLGGKKTEGEDAHGTPSAPIKAKLGEQSSFYYDNEQKRWVNKKDPDATPAPKAAPPPPKGPSRAVSAAGPPSTLAGTTPPVPPLPMGTATPPITFTKPPSSNSSSQHPSRTASPAVATTHEPATGATGPQFQSGPPSAPPSRPSTSMSGASNIDDLIGAPQARKGGTIRKGKKKGYVDVMAK